ncbi:type II toxin-antitoxin system HicB family antitoxin [Candidatus Woesearchaeota archaeon]|nr:type II toxin-antitoxin system HicB family antitoxin [Candidatus Woesearchaeota archaeon]
MARKFHILIEQDEDGVYVGRAIGLKGCVSQGDTVDELMSHMKEAIELCLEAEDPSEERTRFVGVQQLEVS